MQKIYNFKNAISFIKKGISLSLLILLSITAYSNPVDKSTDRKTGYNFLTEKPWFTARPNSKGRGYSTDYCAYALIPSHSEVTSGSGTGMVMVTATETTCAWTATKNADWITLTSGQSGTGYFGTVYYSYTANTTGSSRTGTITIGGQAYTVTQAQALSPDGYEPNNTVAQPYTYNPVFAENANTHTITISPANCHTVADVDIYKINLGAGYSYRVRAILYDKHNLTEGSDLTFGGNFLYSTDGSTWNNLPNRRIWGLTVPGEGSLYLKILADSPGAVGSYGMKIDINIAGTTGCTFSLSAASSQASSEAGGGTVTVTTTSSCFRAAFTDYPWITLTSGQSATGPGYVTYTYLANTTTLLRTGAISIAGQTFTINQAGRSLAADSYEPNNTVANVSQAATFTPAFTGNAYTLSISAATCHNSTDIDIYKIILQAGYSYTLSGVLHDTDNNQTNNNSYTLDVKSYYSTDGTTWTFWGDRVLSSPVVQGGNLYIKIEPFSRGYTGTYGARIDLNRTTGCSPVLSPNREVSAEAGNGLVTVTASSSCASSSWTAASDADWLTLTSGQSGTGYGTVAYSFTANTTGASRTGTITIGGQAYTVTQAAQALSPDAYEPNNTVAQPYTFNPVFAENANTNTITISPANCHTVADVDIYKINLGAGYSYRVRAILYDRHNLTEGSDLTFGGNFLYSTDGSTWNNLIYRRIWGLTVPGDGSLYLKILADSPVAVGSYELKIDINIAGTTGCTFSLSAASRQASSEAGNGAVTVTTTSSCFRAAFTDYPWITLTSGQSATGPGYVTYTYLANTTTLLRTGTISIAGYTFTINQAGRSLSPAPAADSYEPNNTAANVSQAATFTPTFTGNASTLSISAATCHNSTDIDIYKIILQAGYSYTLSGVLHDTDNNQTNNNSYTLDVKSYYSTDGTTWLFWGDRVLSSPVVQGGNLYIKIEPFSSGNTGTYGARIDLNRTTGCSPVLSPNREVSAEAGNGLVTVTASSSCASSSWTATVATSANWITITSGQSGTGSGSVAYSYKANMSTFQRIGTITIAGQTFTITQAGLPLVSDNYEPNNTVEESQATSITPAFTENASTVSISPATCHISTDIDIYKINLGDGYSYTLSGALHDSEYNDDNHTNYTLDVKSYYSTDGSTWIIWGDRQLSNKTMPGGTLFYLKIQPYFSGSTGTYAAKIDINRTVDCRPVLPPTSLVISAEAGNGLVTVTASPSCSSPSSWTAASDADWLTLTSGQSGTGNGTVGYSYTANTTGSSRTGTITIGGKTYTVTQPARPDSYEPNNTVEQPYTYNPVFVENANTFNISPANCHAGDDVDIYKINLRAGYSYRVRAILYDRYNQTEDSDHKLDGKILYSTDGSTWNNLTHRRLWGLTVPGDGSIYFKILPFSQGETGSYALKIDINIAGTTGCTFNLSDTGRQVSSEAGSGEVTVTTTSSCFRAAFTDYPWITLTSGQSATGSGNVAYTYAANMATEERTGAISIAGHTFTITQAGRPLVADSYEPNNTVAQVTQASTFTPTFTDNMSTLSISPANCHHSNDIDIYIINLETGYSYEVSTVLSDRNTRININNYTLNARIFYSTNGSTWSAEYRQLPNLTRQGGTLYLKIVPYYYFGTQEGFYAAKIDIKITEGCVYKLSATSQEATADAGTGKIEVTATTGSLCGWAATSNADWITLKSGQSGKSSGSVEYAYSENKTGAARTGTITVGGQTFTVTQSIVTGIETTGSVKIFPNPAKDFVTIDFSETHIKYASVKIANQLGQILYAQDCPGQTMQIPLKGLTGGVYFIILQGEEKTWVQKLVVK